MELRHLRLLRDLHDYGGVVAAAEATFRSPSAVSQQLRTAERESGIRLVEHVGRGVRLTEAGLLLAAGAERIEVELARLEGQLAEFRGGVAGTVRIAALPSAGEYLLPPVLTQLQGSPIAIQCTDVDLSEGDFALLARDFDVVIAHSLSGVDPAGSADLERRLLCREPIDVALPAGHPLARRKAVTAEQLADLPWIRVPDGYPFATILDRVEQATGRQLRVVQQARDNRLIEAMVVAGLGVALLPRFTTIGRAGLVLRPLRDVESERWVVALSRPDRAARAVVQDVVTRLVEVGSSRHAPPAPASLRTAEHIKEAMVDEEHLPSHLDLLEHSTSDKGMQPGRGRLA